MWVQYIASHSEQQSHNFNHIQNNCHGFQTKCLEDKQTSMNQFLSQPLQHQARNVDPNSTNSRCLSSPPTKSSQDFLKTPFIAPIE